MATILLVEDEPAIRQLMAMSLAGVGYRVLEARNGAEALSLFNESVNLLLTDLRMPYLSGAGLIKRLQSENPLLRILAFSGYPGNPLPEGIPFLAKPFSRAQLLERVATVLG